MDRDLTQHIEQLRWEGYTIIEGVFDQGFVEEARREIDAVNETLGTESDLRRRYDTAREDEFRQQFYGNTYRLRNLLIHNELFRRPAEDPVILEVVGSQLEEGFLLQVATALVRPPGEPDQVLHADDQFVPVPRPHEPFLISSIVALSDFTKENGATCLIPRSHLRSSDTPTVNTGTAITTESEGRHSPTPAAPVHAHVEDEQVAFAEMPQGSVVFWQGSLTHAGGANTSQANRYALGYNYCAGWLRPMDNLGLSLPLDVLGGFSPRLQQLCGVRGRYRDMLGGICDNDPALVLFGS